ncbi:hypothetical protein NQ314_013176 [Rhamnusium bicolor]|uniref:PiggyBac transposable element-derived protein domain-containing protein n=1 Tax=Rhamnusium bicolor TaxID=1586634 RepID=A0AAV8X7A0_9CUCU|nr:hypothetical protein NQ314_013176 [Rhamnusium bicolor]
MDEQSTGVRAQLFHKDELTEEDLFALLEESDEEDPFLNESDDDPEFIPSGDSEEDIESTPSPPETPVPSTSQWSDHEMPKTDIPFTGVSGILVNVSGAEPIDYFNLLATEEFYLYLCTKANTHAVELLSKSKGVQSRISRWQDVTIEEMKKVCWALVSYGNGRTGKKILLKLCPKKLKKGELVVQFNTDGICVIKWKDRRGILAISSEFNGQMEEVTTQRGKVLKKPNLINQYNKFMAGVDHSDQMLGYYSCEHKTLIWYKKLAIHIFQIMLLNSFHLYKKGTGNRKSYYKFRLKVIEKLLGPPPKIQYQQ